MDFLGDAYHLQFLMGIGAALVVRAVSVPAALALLVAGAIGFIVAGIAENFGAFQTTGLVSKLAFGTASAVIVVGVASAERQKLLRFGGVATFFGAASYSIYLVHTIVIGLTARVLAASGLMFAVSDGAVLIVVSVAAITAGLGLYALIERPLTTGLHQLRPGPGLSEAGTPSPLPTCDKSNAWRPIASSERNTGRSSVGGRRQPPVGSAHLGGRAGPQPTRACPKPRPTPVMATG